MRHSPPHLGQRIVIAALVGCLVFGAVRQTWAINIVVDYQYDTNNFFDTQPKKDAMQAAADRFSAMIITSLSASSLADNSTDPRIGFTHPGNGLSWDVSPANSQASDALASSAVAEEYRGPWSLAQDEWILYAGGRSIESAGLGGTGTGLNFTSVFTDGNSHLNRGFRATGSTSNLPVWGGAITFDNDGDVNWHYDHTIAAPLGTTDFYTIALHEVGHALGLSTGWLDWTQWSPGGSFSGPTAVAAYNSDNGAALTSLDEVGGSNHHWEEDTYDSVIYPFSNPNYVGTEGQGNLQDLLMEPSADFTLSRRRIELTNVDVGGAGGHWLGRRHPRRRQRRRCGQWPRREYPFLELARRRRRVRSG